MADVIVIGADRQFSQDAKSVFVNCRIEGHFKGDFALMVPPDYDGEEFKGRGIWVHHVEDRGLYIKMHVFDGCFRRWDRVLAMDCDVQVQGPLSKVFEALGDHSCIANAIYCGRRMDLLEYCHMLDPTPGDHPATYQWLEENCPWLDGSVFDPSMMVFRPIAFPMGNAERIESIKTILAPANPICNDVQVLNVVMGGLVHRIGRTYSLYHDREGEAESPFDYVLNETPRTVLFHFGRDHNPRFKKQPGEQGYRSRRCPTPCHEIYQRNLDKFEEVFPKL